MSPQSVAKFPTAPPVTCHAAVALIGARFAAVPTGAPTGSNPTIPGYPAAGGRVFGVVVQDCTAGSKVGVHTSDGTVTPVLSGAAIPAGSAVQSDATGRAIPLAAGSPAGTLHGAAATAADQVVLIALRPAA